MSLAERTRDGARSHPFLLAALRAGIVNYRAAAEFLDLEGDEEAIATALRRFGETLPEYATEPRNASVTMHGGVGVVDAADVDSEQPRLLVGNTAIVPDAGDLTAVVATGEVDPTALRAVLDRLSVSDVDVVAAGVGSATLLVAVQRRDGASAVRHVEAALDAVPAGGR